MSRERNCNKCTFQLVIQFRSKGEVVHIDDAGRTDLLCVFRVEEVAVDQLVVSIRLSPPVHPLLEQPVHILHDIKVILSF